MGKEQIMYMQDIIFYTIWGFVFCIMVWLVFVVAKAENYMKGYEQGLTDGLRRMNEEGLIISDESDESFPF